MAKFSQWLGSSIGKKQVVGLTGFGIALFSLSHMASNLLIPFSAKAYNYYGYGLAQNPALPLIELVLAAAFVVHIFFAASLSISNRRARQRDNVTAGSGPKHANFGSRSMILTGMLILVFLVLHLITFRFGTYYTVIYDGIEMRDLHRLVLEKFHDPLYVGWYLFSLAVLLVHLSHGASSLFQSIGIAGVRNRTVRQIGWALAIVIAGGFMVSPIWVVCCGGQG